ncbi:Syntaxin-7 [Mortierella sp. AD031]|nr:Syntaxin-7 [Mortierella sp. AD031]
MTPRSPQSVSTTIATAASFQSGIQANNYNNRVLGNNHQRQGQMLSPPTSPPQFSPQSSPLHQHSNRIDTHDHHDHEGGVSIAIDHPTTAATTTTTTQQQQQQITTTSIGFATSSSTLQEQELDYDLMVRHLSQQIFNISSNIAVLERLVPCLGQRHKDTVEMRASLHAVLDGTQELVKSAHGLVKVLARYHQPPSIPHSGIGIGIRSQQQQRQQQEAELSSWQRKVLVSRRQTHQRLTKDLALVSKDFQVLQREAIEAERCQVAILRRLSSSASMRRLSLNRRSDLMDLSPEEIQAGALSVMTNGGSSSRNSNGQGRSTSDGNNSSFPELQLLHGRELSVQEEALLKELLAMDGELAMQESILQERESEIRKIEEGMVEVLDVMKELGTLVHEQRGGVDFLQDNILQARGRIQQGQQEIVKASEHQRRSREKLCYIIMIASTVGAIVMLAFIST